MGDVKGSSILTHMESILKATHMTQSQVVFCITTSTLKSFCARDTVSKVTKAFEVVKKT
jgi:hypothetical protein